MCQPSTNFEELNFPGAGRLEKALEEALEMICGQVTSSCCGQAQIIFYASERHRGLTTNKCVEMNFLNF